MPRRHRVHQKMPRVEQVMPVGPAAGPDRLIRLVPRLDLHVRNEPGLLPRCEVSFHIGRDLLFPVQILGGGGCKPSTRITFSGGDIEPEVQEAIYKSGLLTRVDVLKVSHHGSAYQYLPMLEILNPKVAIISVGEGNSYGHPDGKFINELANRGAKVWRTDQSGGISVISTNKIRVVGKEWWKIRWD